MNRYRYREHNLSVLEAKGAIVCEHPVHFTRKNNDSFDRDRVLCSASEEKTSRRNKTRMEGRCTTERNKIPASPFISFPCPYAMFGLPLFRTEEDVHFCPFTGGSMNSIFLREAIEGIECGLLASKIKIGFIQTYRARNS